MSSRKRAIEGPVCRVDSKWRLSIHFVPGPGQISNSGFKYVANVRSFPINAIYRTHRLVYVMSPSPDLRQERMIWPRVKSAPSSVLRHSHSRSRLATAEECRTARISYAGAPVRVMVLTLRSCPSCVTSPTIFSPLKPDMLEHGQTRMSTTPPGISRRHAPRLLGGGFLAATVGFRTSDSTEAARSWCRADPVPRITGQKVHVYISSPPEMLKSATD